MGSLSARTRISELASESPAMLDVLKSCGLYREGDDATRSLGELCWTNGFNPGILMLMLQSAASASSSDDTGAPLLDATPFREMPLAALVDHVEEVHHAFLRSELPRLTALTANVAAAHGDPWFASLRDTVQELATELEAHLRHEEEALFPMVRDLLAKRVVTPTRCGGSLGGPIACMENEHHRADDALMKIRDLTNDFAIPAGADDDCRSMIAGLAHLDRDLREHMFKEDEVLFPRALDIQRELRPANIN